MKYTCYVFSASNFRSSRFQFTYISTSYCWNEENRSIFRREEAFQSFTSAEFQCFELSAVKVIKNFYVRTPSHSHVCIFLMHTHTLTTSHTHTYTHICTRKSFFYTFFSLFPFFYTQTNTHHWLDFHDHNTSQITIHLFSLIYHNLRYFIYRITSHSTQNHQEISAINQ